MASEAAANPERLAELARLDQGLARSGSRISEFLQRCPFIAKFSLSETLTRSDELPLACAQTSLALEHGTKIALPDNHPSEGFLAPLSAIAAAEKADQLTVCLREYVETALADQRNFPPTS